MNEMRNGEWGMGNGEKAETIGGDRISPLPTPYSLLPYSLLPQSSIPQNKMTSTSLITKA
jgi:hypothetical protein